MLIDCTTKGCLKLTEAKLNKDTGDVICEECGNAIIGITPYMKKVLENSRQTISSVKKQAFQAMCMSCQKSQPLVIKGNNAHCKDCGAQVQISASFMQGLKLFLEAQAKSEAAVEAEEAKATLKKNTKK